MPGYGRDISKFKVVVYLTNGEKWTHYSYVSEEKGSNEKVINAMVRRLLFKRYKGKYQTAQIYYAKIRGDWSGDPIQKWVYGTKEY